MCPSCLHKEQRRKSCLAHGNSYLAAAFAFWCCIIPSLVNHLLQQNKLVFFLKAFHSNKIKGNIFISTQSLKFLVPIIVTSNLKICCIQIQKDLH